MQSLKSFCTAFCREFATRSSPEILYLIQTSRTDKKWLRSVARRGAES